MPTVTLKPHPDSPASPAERIEVEVERRGEAELTLAYRVFGDLSRLQLPEMSEEAAGRTEELWKHTCFEAFLEAEGREGYLELNFATSLQWASYRFSGYREGMSPASVQPEWMQSGLRDPLWLEVGIGVGRLARPDLPAPDWRIGLSAVIEDIDGNLSYWALAHPPGKPDFHHPDSFALSLPPPEPA